MKIGNALLAASLLICLGQEAIADNTYILATGRRDPRMYAIDLKEALKPQNNNTPNAIVSRSKTALDRLDGKLLGDPANIVISEDGKTAYVVNHHGAIDNDEFLQHGGRGNIAVMDVRKMTQRGNDNTAGALDFHIDSGHFGAVGLVLLRDMFVIGNAESHLSEDGGNRITFVDRKTGSLRGQVELALGKPGFACPDFPVPFVSPHGPPSPLPLLSPNAAWGCFPDTNGITVGTASDGKHYLFTANGGTNDVSVVDLAAILDKKTTAEEVNAALKSAAEGPLKGILEYSTEELVSIDFKGNPRSSIVDSAYTKVMDGDFVKVLSWYDNEWGYSNRCVDLLRLLVKKGL